MDQYYEIYDHLCTTNDVYNIEDIIDINIGGQIFRTIKQTLNISSVFEARIKNWSFDNKMIFFDRSSQDFHNILSYLRKCGDIKNCNPTELDFYGLKNLDYNINKFIEFRHYNDKKRDFNIFEELKAIAASVAFLNARFMFVFLFSRIVLAPNFLAKESAEGS